MAVIDSVEYSVCVDCLLFIAYDEVPEDALGRGDKRMHDAVQRELGGRTGHFVAGIAPTEDDPDGAGDQCFSWHPCELCCSTLGGSRHGVTLLLTDEGSAV